MATDVQPVPQGLNYNEFVKRFLDILRRAVSTNADDIEVIEGEIDVLQAIHTVVRITTTPYSATSTDGVLFVNTDSLAIVINLPAGVQSKRFRIINTGTSGNNVTINPDGTEDLLGVNSAFTLTDGQALIISFDTTDGWY